MKTKAIPAIVFSIMLLVSCGTDTSSSESSKGAVNVVTTTVTTTETVSQTDTSTASSEIYEYAPEEARGILKELNSKLPDSHFEVKFDSQFNHADLTYYDFYEYYDDIRIDNCIRYCNGVVDPERTDGYVFGEIITDGLESKEDIKYSVKEIVEKNPNVDETQYAETIYCMTESKGYRLAYHFKTDLDSTHIYISPITGEVVGSFSDIIID